jgi:hypothetical protein
VGVCGRIGRQAAVRREDRLVGAGTDTGDGEIADDVERVAPQRRAAVLDFLGERAETVTVPAADPPPLR